MPNPLSLLSICFYDYKIILILLGGVLGVGFQNRESYFKIEFQPVSLWMPSARTLGAIDSIPGGFIIRV